MTNAAQHLIQPGSQLPVAHRRPGLGRCIRGGTIVEYALAAALIATAAASVRSHRLHEVKDGGCSARSAGCPASPAALASDEAAKAGRSAPYQSARESLRRTRL